MAQKRRPKRSRRKPSPVSTKGLVRIGLTVLAVAALCAVAYMLFTAKEPLEPDQVRDQMLLALSRTGIPATDAERMEGDQGFSGFRLKANSDQAAAIEKRLKESLSGYAFKMKTQEKGSTRTLIVASGGKRYELILRGAVTVSQKPEKEPEQQYPDHPVKPKPEPKKMFSGQPRVAIILDDVGLGSMNSFRQALEIPYPLTFAIIPFRRFTRECASMARGNGFEMIVHMPMEPYGYPKEDPGPGAIFESDSREQIIKKVEAALDSVSYAQGMNNHMGSKITALPFTMRVILGTLKREGLFFIDSRTTSDTVAEQEAVKMRVPVLPRNVFLDNVREPEAIRKQLAEAVRFATKHGYVIALGHNYPETISVLATEMPRLDRTVNFVFARELVDEASRTD